MSNLCSLRQCLPRRNLYDLTKRQLFFWCETTIRNGNWHWKKGTPWWWHEGTHTSKTLLAFWPSRVNVKMEIYAWKMIPFYYFTFLYQSLRSSFWTLVPIHFRLGGIFSRSSNFYKILSPLLWILSTKENIFPIFCRLFLESTELKLPFSFNPVPSSNLKY